MKLSLKIALRFNRSKKQNILISLSSIVSIISITLSVAALIIGLSIMNGFEKELKNRILSILPHGEIEFIKTKFKCWQQIVKKIEKIPNIISAAPYINFSGIVIHNDKMQIIKIKGIDLIQEIKLNNLSYYIKEKYLTNFSAGQKQIIIGKGIAKELKINYKDWITVIITNDKNKKQTQILKTKKINLQVIGIINLHSQLDSSFAIIPLEDAKKYLQQTKNFNGIAVKVKNIFNINKTMQKTIKKIKNNSYVTFSDWISNYGYLYRDIQKIRIIIYLTMILIISISIFNITSVLTIMLKNKKIDIAVLQTLGAKNKLIYAIFIWYGFLTSIIGNLLGILIGILITFKLPKIIKIIENILHIQLFMKNVYFIDFLPTEIHGTDILITLTTVTIVSLLVSLYPAKQANHIKIANILNNQY